MRAYTPFLPRSFALLIVAAFPILCNQARAQFTTSTNSDGSLTITGYTGSGGAVTIPNEINGLTVTSIGDDAFDDTSLTSVTIPDCITSIGDGAFTYTRLTSIMIPDSVTSIGDYAFAFTSLTSITIPNSVTSIGANAFAEDQSVGPWTLTSVTIGNNVTSIGANAFLYCQGLTSVTIGNNVTSIGEGAFKGTSLTSITIPDSVTSIGAYAFAENQLGPSTLTSVTIGNNVTSIGGDAFDNCFSLTAINVDPSNPSYSSVAGVLFNQNQTTLIQFPAGLGGSYTIPSSVANIGDYAFYQCASLTSITIPNTVTSIGAYAFVDTSVASITIPNSVTSIGENAFQFTNLASVTIPDSVTSIGENAFQGSDLASVTFENGVTNIGDGAFAGATSLTSITIPDSVTSIGVSAFENCTSLASITIPGSVTSIGENAFQGSGLTSATIGTGVTNIGDSAFAGSTRLTSVYFAGNAPSADSAVFFGDPNVTVYYYSGATGWGSPFAGVPAVMLNPPAISPPPASAAVVVGANAMFIVATSANPAPIVYQWQVSTDGGNTWNNVSGSAYGGATTGTLTITAPGTTFLGYQFRAVITNPAGIINTTPVPLIVGTSSTNLTWLQSNFTSAQLGQPGIVGDLAEPAGDGIPNLIKYAFNLTAFTDGQASLPQSTVSNGQVTLAFQALQSDLTYSVEGSTDLINWSATGVTVQTNGLQVTASYPIPAGGQAFLRITVSP